MIPQRNNDSDFMKFLFVKNTDGTTDFFPMFPFGMGYKLKSEEEIVKVKKVYGGLMAVLFVLIGAMNLLPGPARGVLAIIFAILLLVWVFYPKLSNFTPALDVLPVKTRIQMMIIETPLIVSWLLFLVFLVPFLSLTYLVLRRWHVIIDLAAGKTGPTLLFGLDFLLLLAVCASGWVLYRKYKVRRQGNVN